jgi:hypothetical protein
LAGGALLVSVCRVKNPEEIDPDWGRYAETILIFGDGERPRIDLRENLTPDVRAYFRSIGFDQTFAVLTAHDPLGRDLGAEENRERQEKLEGEVHDAGIHFVRVDACSADREHCECSLAIDIDQDHALRIAKMYEQMAIFWYDGECFWLLGAVVNSDPLRLPRTA